MRATIVRIGATGAGALLALGLFAAPPAGATGSARQSKGEQSKAEQSKDERSGRLACFNTEGRTQGRSHSDPDGMSNNGPDKPGCEGGFDADKDGNNGCGNDADREDDNNGNCRGPKAQRSSNAGAQRERRNEPRVKAAKVEAEKVDADIKDDEDNAVLGATDVRAQAAGSVPAAGVLAAEVSTATADAAPAPTTVAAAGVPTPAAAETTTPETQVMGETLSAPDNLARTGAGIGGLALLGGLLFGGGRLTVLARRFLRIG